MLFTAGSDDSDVRVSMSYHRDRAASYKKKKGFRVPDSCQKWQISVCVVCFKMCNSSSVAEYTKIVVCVGINGIVHELVSSCVIRWPMARSFCAKRKLLWCFFCSATAMFVVAACGWVCQRRWDQFNTRTCRHVLL